jgi:lysophospholipase L1-like esterase
MPRSTNHHLKNLTVLAHINDIKVLAISPTPWGSEGQSKHKGIEGLKRRRATQLVTDFLTGRIGAEEALGEHARKRPAGASADWDPIELPDIAVDVYDSPLRARDASPRDAAKLRKALEKDRDWQKDHADLSEEQKSAELDADAKDAAEVPLWFMSPGYRAFDDVHPNTDGHRVIAQMVCPNLPLDWGCECDKLVAE